MKIFLGAHLQFFGSGRKIFGHPAPRRPIFGDAEISAKIDFWSKIGIFAILWAWCTKKGWVHEKNFQKNFSPESLVFGKITEKGLEWVFTPKWHTWNFRPFWVKSWYFHIFRGFRNFGRRKCGFGVRGGRKFFGPCKKHPKGFPKKFSCPLDVLNQLWGSVSVLLSPQNVKIFKLRGGTFHKPFGMHFNFRMRLSVLFVASLIFSNLSARSLYVYKRWKSATPLDTS